MGRLSLRYHCVQLIIALLVSSQTAQTIFQIYCIAFPTVYMRCYTLCRVPEHYLPELLMSTAYLSIYDGIILSLRHTLPDNRCYLRL